MLQYMGGGEVREYEKGEMKMQENVKQRWKIKLKMEGNRIRKWNKGAWGDSVRKTDSILCPVARIPKMKKKFPDKVTLRPLR